MSNETRLHFRLYDETRLPNRGKSTVSWARHLSLPVLRKLAPDHTTGEKAPIQQGTKTKVL